MSNSNDIVDSCISFGKVNPDIDYVTTYHKMPYEYFILVQYSM